MKKTTLLSIILLLFSSIFYSQTLGAGDIAFIGYNTDAGTGTNDNFTIIALTDIPAGEIIYFTEEGWDTSLDTWAGTTEGHLTWTSPTGGISCGTIISFNESSANTITVTGGGSATLSSGAGWSLTGGDQVLAYYSASGPEPAGIPTFISGINGDDGNGSPTTLDPTTLWNDPSAVPLGTARSALPAGLTNAVDCISLFPAIGTETDNAKYNGTLSGDSNTIRASINNRSNWISDNNIAYDITPSGYSAPSVNCIAACTDPDVPTIVASPTAVCNGNTTTLNITGSLNDATQWVVYTGSCGGTQVGTTTSSSIVVTPTGPSTTYFIRGEGGCVTPGSCGSVSVTVNNLDDASFNYSSSTYCVDDADPTPTITGLTGGTFSSTAGLSINTTTGQIDVSASTPDTYTVTYTTAGTCPNSSNASVTINALDNPSFNYSSSAYCVDDADPTPTITGLTGGTFSSTAGLSINTTTGQIDVSASTPNTYTVTYTTAGTCPNSSNASVTINALDDPFFNYSSSAYCVDDADPTPTITGLTGGTFSSTAGLSINTTTGQIDVSASTPNTYTVTYTTAGTCPNSSNASVTINALDDPSFNYSVSAYCVDDADPTPTITGLTGGTFSSTVGLSINTATGQIDVSASTPNTYTVTYTTAGTCPNSSNASVTINTLDDPSFNYSSSAYCVDDTDPTPTITGLTGGTFSSTAGLSINTSTGQIDVSASTPNTYTVTYTTAGTCPNSSNVSVTINALDDPSFNYSASAYCVDDADPTPTITGLTGGTFSSTAGLSINTSTGQIDVSASTPNTYTVTYTTAGTCPNSSNASVTINALDDPSFNYNASAYCVDNADPTPTITGLTGGTFSSTAGLSINTTTGQIDVSASTPNTYSVTYTTAGTCPNSSNASVTINALDDPSFNYSTSTYCVDDADPTPTITGLTGGTFSSTAGLSINTTTGQIDVSASTPNTYTVTYTTAGTCPNSSNTSVTINALDDATFSYTASSYLTTDADPTPTITGVTGGSFASTTGLSLNSSTGEIDVSASTPNTYTVTYATVGTCPNSSDISVTIIDPAPTVSITSTESPGPTGANPIPITVTFSESVTGFDINDVTTGNGNATNFTGSGDTYTFDITPIANGTVTVDIAADVATDGAGNGNIIASQFTIIFDNLLNTDDEILEMELNIYPVPSKNVIYIPRVTNVALKNVEIFDVRGKIIVSQQLNKNDIINTIDITSIPSGLYLITIYSETGSTTKRIIKE
ncbi:T9SS type A sorting domain-containing protein [uncultured Aquimarina sp.]|uniref:beta strand repeat-containing protein n=1 Tax=uncultured Aquimarina sp. TaxID=575652 RepID=UPI00261BEEDE|nr:T9SS type A sorting domain-containing protein [uncultured Aquimarina sp.]